MENDSLRWDWPLIAQPSSHALYKRVMEAGTTRLLLRKAGSELQS
jgi:hypothetical protein